MGEFFIVFTRKNIPLALTKQAKNVKIMKNISFEVSYGIGNS